MTRPTIDSNVFNQGASSGKAALVSDPANAFITNVITYLNNISADLDTANIPATTGAAETVTSGALSATIPLHYVSISGTKAYTQPDGTVVGQVSIVECSVAGSTPVGTLTITTPLSGESATHVFDTVGQRLELVWQTGGWHCYRKVRAGTKAVVVGTTVLTGFDMCVSYKLSVTGTVHSTTTKGIPNGTVPGERIHISTGTAASSPVGDIAITATTRTAMAAATSLANLTDTTMSLTLEWDGAAWQAIEFTAGSGTATLS